MQSFTTVQSLFDAGLVPLVEWALGLKNTPATIRTMIQNRLGSNADVPLAASTQFIARVNQAMARASGLERAEFVAPSAVPIDPSLFGREDFRYRVRVGLLTGGAEVSSVVVPVPSDRLLSAADIRDIAEGLVRNRSRVLMDTLPGGAADVALSVPDIEVGNVRVISVYRSPTA